METYLDAGAGLKKMFIASIGIVICTVLLIVPGINLVAAVATIVLGILSLVGLYQAGKDIEGCKKAFMLTIAKLVLSGLGNVAQSIMMTLIVSLATYIVDVLVVYLVCTSVSEITEKLGQSSVADKGRLTWKLYLGCYIAVIVLAVLMVIPSLLGVALVAGLATTLFSVVAMILYTIFLYQSSNALQ